jgi:hypothetical protein
MIVCDKCGRADRIIQLYMFGRLGDNDDNLLRLELCNECRDKLKDIIAEFPTNCIEKKGHIFTRLKDHLTIKG